MASQSLTRVLALKARAEKFRKEQELEQAVAAAESFDVRSLLFDRQKEVLDRLIGRQFHGICCPRRSGKTNFIIALLFETALKTGRDVVYVGLTRKSAKKTVWAPPKGLGIEKIGRSLGGQANLQELSITLPNGAHVYVEGILDDRVKERFRGQSYALVVLDECQSIAPDLIEPFVDDVLEPTIADNDGTLILSGTPSEFCSGLFWEVVGAREHDEKYCVHTWSWEDNPYVVEKVRAMAEKRREKYGDDDPTYLREYRGKWVPDRNSLCLPNFSAKNEMDVQLWPPKSQVWYSTIGVDIGGGGDGDPAVVARSTVFKDDPKVYLQTRTVDKPGGGLTDTEILEVVRQMSEGWNVCAASIDSSIAIGPAPGRNFPIDPAAKREKEQQLRRMDDDLFREVLVVAKGDAFCDEARTVFWDKKKLEQHKKVPTSAVPNDHLDAGQYSYLRLVNLQVLPPIPETLDERMRREAMEAASGRGGPRDWKTAVLGRAS